MSKKDRSLANSRDEAKKIYYQRKEINKLQQENQQLSNELRIKNEELRIKGKVLDEIRKVLNNQMDYREFVDIVNKIEEILDKVKE